MLNKIGIFVQKFQVALVCGEGEEIGSSLLRCRDNLFINVFNKTNSRACIFR